MRFLLVCFLLTMTTYGWSQTAEDEKAIRQAMQQMQEAWNRNDVPAMMQLCSEDVQFVNPVGMWWNSRAKFQKALTVFHQTMFKGVTFKYDEIGIQFLRPDVPVVSGVSNWNAYTTPEGVKVESSKGVDRYVITQEKGAWLFRSGHVTTVDQKAAAFDPGK